MGYGQLTNSPFESMDALFRFMDKKNSPKRAVLYFQICRMLFCRIVDGCVGSIFLDGCNSVFHGSGT